MQCQLIPLLLYELTLFLANSIGVSFVVLMPLTTYPKLLTDNALDVQLA